MIDVLMRLYRYKFLIELSIFSLLFIWRLPRRKKFLVRLLPCIICCVALSSQWTLAMSQIMGLSVLRYLILFISLVLTIWISFECTIKVALFCGVGAYAAQHLYFNVYNVINAVFSLEQSWLIISSYLFSFILVMGFVGLAFTRKIDTHNVQYMANKKNLVLCGIILIFTVVLSVFSSNYVPNDKVEMKVICSIYDGICCILALWIQLGLFQLDNMRQEMEIVQQLWNIEKKQLAASQENIDLINIKCHDMKHLISRLVTEGNLATETEVKDIQKLIDIYDFQVNTENDILNLLLMEKSLICQSQNIRINCMVDGKKLSIMEDSDIYSLFGNAIDNAINAVQEIPDTDKRVITLTIKSVLGMLSICLENYYSGEILFKNGLPVTDKLDKHYHGYGMKSIRYMVEKYHGELSIKTENGIFTLNIIFPYDE